MFSGKTTLKIYKLGITLVKPKDHLTPRRKMHIRNTKQCAKGFNIAKHAWTLNHTIDFDNATIITKGNDRTRKTLESWHMAKTVEADNNSCPLSFSTFSILFTFFSYMNFYL